MESLRRLFSFFGLLLSTRMHYTALLFVSLVIVVAFASSGNGSLNPEQFDVLILGGGPAGLAAAKAFRDLGVRNFLVVEGESLGGKLREWGPRRSPAQAQIYSQSQTQTYSQQVQESESVDKELNIALRKAERRRKFWFDSLNDSEVAGLIRSRQDADEEETTTGAGALDGPSPEQDLSDSHRDVKWDVLIVGGKRSRSNPSGGESLRILHDSRRVRFNSDSLVKRFHTRVLPVLEDPELLENAVVKNAGATSSAFSVLRDLTSDLDDISVAAALRLLQWKPDDTALHSLLEWYAFDREFGLRPRLLKWPMFAAGEAGGGRSSSRRRPTRRFSRTATVDPRRFDGRTKTQDGGVESVSERTSESTSEGAATPHSLLASLRSALRRRSSSFDRDHVRVGERVIRIEQAHDGRLRVVTLQQESLQQKTYLARFVVSALPLGVLQTQALFVVSALPLGVLQTQALFPSSDSSQRSAVPDWKLRSLSHVEVANAFELVVAVELVDSSRSTGTISSRNWTNSSSALGGGGTNCSWPENHAVLHAHASRRGGGFPLLVNLGKVIVSEGRVFQLLQLSVVDAEADRLERLSNAEIRAEVASLVAEIWTAVCSVGSILNLDILAQPRSLRQSSLHRGARPVWPVGLSVAENGNVCRPMLLKDGASSADDGLRRDALPRLWFAGDHCAESPAAMGTLEAALKSGRAVAELLADCAPQLVADGNTDHSAVSTGLRAFGTRCPDVSVRVSRALLWVVGTLWAVLALAGGFAFATRTFIVRRRKQKDHSCVVDDVAVVGGISKDVVVASPSSVDKSIDFDEADEENSASTAACEKKETAASTPLFQDLAAAVRRVAGPAVGLPTWLTWPLIGGTLLVVTDAGELLTWENALDKSLGLSGEEHRSFGFNPMSILIVVWVTCPVFQWLLVEDMVVWRIERNAKKVVKKGEENKRAIRVEQKQEQVDPNGQAGESLEGGAGGVGDGRVHDHIRVGQHAPHDPVGGLHRDGLMTFPSSSHDDEDLLHKHSSPRTIPVHYHSFRKLHAFVAHTKWLLSGADPQTPLPSFVSPVQQKFPVMPSFSWKRDYRNRMVPIGLLFGVADTVDVISIFFAGGGLVAVLGASDLIFSAFWWRIILHEDIGRRFIVLAFVVILANFVLLGELDVVPRTDLQFLDVWRGREADGLGSYSRRGGALAGCGFVLVSIQLRGLAQALAEQIVGESRKLGLAEMTKAGAVGAARERRRSQCEEDRVRRKSCRDMSDMFSPRVGGGPPVLDPGPIFPASGSSVPGQELVVGSVPPIQEPDKEAVINDTGKGTINCTGPQHAEDEKENTIGVDETKMNGHDDPNLSLAAAQLGFPSTTVLLDHWVELRGLRLTTLLLLFEGLGVVAYVPFFLIVGDGSPCFFAGWGRIEIWLCVFSLFGCQVHGALMMYELRARTFSILKLVITAAVFGLSHWIFTPVPGSSQEDAKKLEGRWEVFAVLGLILAGSYGLILEGEATFEEEGGEDAP